MASTMKHIKVILTNNRSVTIEVDSALSAKDWLTAIKRDGSNVVELNGTGYPKEDLVDATEVKARTGHTNID